MKRFRWIAAAIVAIALALVAVEYSLSGHGVPKILGTLSLAQAVSGSDARVLVNKMHGRAVTPQDNVVGTYKGAGGSAKLYVSYYPSADSARNVAFRMAGRIESGIPPFEHFRTYEEGKNPVFMCLGLGQAHFFFVCNERLYWLASDIGVAEAALSELRKEVCQ
jgi:hypothetical protein